jgi:hypothetical protein
MANDPKNRRREDRIPLDSLPECLKTVSFSTGIFQEHTAHVVDASNYGMSFVAEDLKTSSIHTGQDLTIKVLPFNYKLRSRICYVASIGENKVRFGIEFHNGPPIDKYHEILTQNIYK